MLAVPFEDELGRFARYKRFSHHPVCDRYNDHLLSIGEIRLCLGCTCLYVGIFLGLLLLVVLGGIMTDFTMTWLFSLALFIPTLVQVKYQKKSYKIIARTLLGISIVLMFYSILFMIPWNPVGIIFKLIFISLFYLVYSYTNRYRRENIDDPCRECPSGVYPFCGAKLCELKELHGEIAGREGSRELSEFLYAVIYQIDHPDEPKRVRFEFV